MVTSSQHCGQWNRPFRHGPVEPRTGQEKHLLLPKGITLALGRPNDDPEKTLDGVAREDRSFFCVHTAGGVIAMKAPPDSTRAGAFSYVYSLPSGRYSYTSMKAELQRRQRLNITLHDDFENSREFQTSF